MILHLSLYPIKGYHHSTQAMAVKKMMATNVEDFVVEMTTLMLNKS